MHQARLRAARPDDGAAVAAIFEHYVLETVVTFETVPPSADDWSARIAAAAETGHPFIVAEDGHPSTVAEDGPVVGYAYLTPWRPKPAYDHTVENTVYLDPEWRGRGLGRALLVELIERATATGYRRMIAVIADSGDPASVALHTATGFEPVGTLEGVGLKFGRLVDTLLMQRRLD